MSKLFHTGDGSEGTVAFVSLQIVTPPWFRRSLIAAIGLMCNDENWGSDGDASVDFARDKSVEMLNSIEFSDENPTGGDMRIIGEIMQFMGDVADIPDKWLLCDGSLISETTYADLFALIGTRFGSDGSGNFRLPDLRGKTIVGVNNDVTDFEWGDTGGETEHTLTVNEMPAHTHTSHVQTSAGNGGGQYIQSARTLLNALQTGSTGGDEPHNNMQPYAAFPQIVYTGVSSA